MAEGHVGAPVSSIATLFPYSVRPSDPVATAQELMTAHSVRRLVVATAGGVVGVVSVTDIARCCAPLAPAAELELDTLCPEDEPVLRHEP